MFKEYNQYKKLIESKLDSIFNIHGLNNTLKDAMSYSVKAGGKRLRPVLNLLANDLLDGNTDETITNACAIEMIHTYSLIHDDLPAMDNDELRRGKPTNHVMFGEDFAILAGDGLLSYAFEIILNDALNYPDNYLNHIKAARIIANSCGIFGMVCGQASDIELEGQILSQSDIDYIHERKTGAMITGSLLSGLVLCSPDDKQYNAIRIFGENIGVSFQIIDDILDETGTEKELGKTTGKDKNAHKFTYPVLFGIEQSYNIARKKTEEAIDEISIFGKKADYLSSLAINILERTK